MAIAFRDWLVMNPVESMGWAQTLRKPGIRVCITEHKKHYRTLCFAEKRPWFSGGCSNGFCFSLN